MLAQYSGMTAPFWLILGEVELELVGWLVQMIDGLDEVPRGASSMLVFSFADFMR